MLKTVSTTVFASGLQSPEGPSFDRQGVLHFVDWDAKEIYRVQPDGTHSVLVHTGGMPTGSKFHKNGHLYVADGDLGILDISPQGEMRVAADGYQGQKFRGPNDLVFAPNGDLYFSDPRGSDPEHPVGSLFILRSSGKVELFAGGFQFPNGVVFSHDGRTLYMAETYPKHILAFEVNADGSEKSRRVFAQLEGGVGPDGMAFGKDGNLYVAHFGKGVVAVLDAGGALIHELEVGGINPTNVAFWNTSLYVTEVKGGQVFKLDVGVEGQNLFGLTG